MKSELDEYKSWMNAKINFDIHLTIELEEVGDSNALAKVEFEDVLCWQCFDESADLLDKGMVIDEGGFISTIKTSKYLNYVVDDFGWFMERQPPVKHYRVWSEDDVVDVIAYQAPKVKISVGGEDT